jgi:hypothetical protein
VPKGRVKYVHKDEDPRDYRVDFNRIQKKLGFSITKKVPDGIREVYQILKDGLLTNPDSDYYRNS